MIIKCLNVNPLLKMILIHSARLKSDFKINFPLYFFQTFHNEYKAVSEYFFTLNYITTQQQFSIQGHQICSKLFIWKKQPA